MAIRFLAFIGILTATLYSVGAYAKAQFEAGDIEVGQKWVIQANGDIASYYKNGKSGEVKFVCDLEPANNDNSAVRARLYSTKNFGLHYGFITKGRNGPYTWRLSELGEDRGNILVALIEGDKNNQATIQCKTVV